MTEEESDVPGLSANGEIGHWLTVLVNSMPDYVWTKDLDGRFLALNKAGASLCGQSDPLRPVGMTDYDFFPADLAGGYRACDKRVHETRRQEEVVERLILPDGKAIWLETTKSPLLDASGRLLGTVGVARDISARKTIEDKVNEARRLTMLGRLAGGIAHNFNNLFGTILGYSRFAMEDLPADHPAADHSRRITAVGQKGKAIVEQILAFSDMGNPVRKPFPLSGLIAEVERFLLAAAPRGQRIITKLAPHDMVVDGDERQILQIITKLCLNGREALDGGPGTITLGLEATDLRRPVLQRLYRTSFAASGDTEIWIEGDGTIWLATGCFAPFLDHVSFTVEDSAKGIGLEVMRQLFTPFFTTKPAEHLGLGLAIVRETIMAHHGAILIRSQPGNGTRVEVILPLA